MQFRNFLKQNNSNNINLYLLCMGVVPPWKKHRDDDVASCPGSLLALSQPCLLPSLLPVTQFYFFF